MAKPAAVPIAVAAITAAGSVASAAMKPKPPKPAENKSSMPTSSIGQASALSRKSPMPVFSNRSQMSAMAPRSSLAQTLINS